MKRRRTIILPVYMNTWRKENENNSYGYRAVHNINICCVTGQYRYILRIVRAHFSKRGILKVCKAFLSRICHAVVFTQFGYADSKSAPCQALFLVFPVQNWKTKWPPKQQIKSQLSGLYIMSGCTADTQTWLLCSKYHFCFEEFHVPRPGQLSRKKSKMAANNTESTITFF